MEQVFADWNFEDNFHLSTNKRPSRLEEDDLVELLWRDGQVVLQSQARREPLVQIQTHKQGTLDKPNNNTVLDNQETVQKPNNAFLEDQETVSWIQYPPDEDPFESEFSSHFFSSIDDHLEKPKTTTEETVKHEAQAMAPPKFRSTAVTVGPSHCESNQVTKLPVTMNDRSKNVEEKNDTSSGGSSGCSYGRNNNETVSGRSVTIDRKRKHVMVDADQESVSQSDIRLISTNDDQVTGNKSSQRSGSTRRSRAAEVHNLSERRRRDRINEKMKALQELVPHCSKTDKVSILDEAIDYLKSLQMQLQVMWMGSGMAAAAAAPMMFPGVQSSPYINQMAMHNSMQLPQFPVMNRSVQQNNHPGLVCQNPVQFQLQAQNQILSEQLARYMGRFPQMPAATNQAVHQPVDKMMFGSPAGPQSQLSAPAPTTDSLHMGK